MATLERAIAIAAEAHAGQFDKGGAPYVLHTMRVMLRVTKPEERIAAALHDVLEDNPSWTLERLRDEGFTPAVLAAIEALTRRPEEPYVTYIRRAGANPIARTVKLADLEDNLDGTRISNPTEIDRQRLARYSEAQALLRECEAG